MATPDSPKKTKLLSSKEIILLLVVSIAILFTPYILSQPNFWVSLNDEGLAFIGTAISGITAPFIGIFGSVLVYIAFKVQYRANLDIKEQFKQQNNDQLYYKLVDGLYDRFKNSVVQDSEEKEFNGLEIPKYLVDSMTKYFHKASNDNGKIIIWTHPNEVDDSFYKQFHKDFSSSIPAFKSVSDGLLKQSFVGMKLDEMMAILDKANTIRPSYFRLVEVNYFYKVPFETRRLFYNNAYNNILTNHGGLLESYFSNLTYLLGYVLKHINEHNTFYKDYLKSNFNSLRESSNSVLLRFFSFK